VSSSPTGLIFDIKKYAVHDGPGIRTTVFFKGCPLSCSWCHNPEGLRPTPELILFEGKCIDCGECFRICPHQAHEVTAAGDRAYHRDRCALCGDCVEACFAEALVMEGREVTVDEVMVELRKDTPFYRASGGGITISGGEPLHQHEFAAALLQQCRADDLHTTIDTSGQAPWEVVERVLQHVDLVLFDIKHLDDERHRAHTGVSNRQILENLARIGRSGVPLEIRMPLVPGVNDTEEDVARAARFLLNIQGITRVVLLPYHRLGEGKYTRLGRDNRLRDLEPPGSEEVNGLAERMRSFGLDVVAGV